MPTPTVTPTATPDSPLFVQISEDGYACTACPNRSATEGLSTRSNGLHFGHSGTRRSDGVRRATWRR
jgi:hypothetical protein